MNEIMNFLTAHWGDIVVLTLIACGVYVKISKIRAEYDDDEKLMNELVASAKAQIKETILYYVTEAEYYFEEVAKSGQIKRAKVISEIFEKYPILAEVANQEEVVAWLDEMINEALDYLDYVCKQNKDND